MREKLATLDVLEEEVEVSFVLEGAEAAFRGASARSFEKGPARKNAQVHDEGVGDMCERTALRVEVLYLSQTYDGDLLKNLHRKVVWLPLAWSRHRRSQAC